MAILATLVETLQLAPVISMVLARPLPISALAVRWADVITLVPEQPQPNSGRVAGVHVEVAVPFVAAASRYLQSAVISTPHLNDVGAT